MLYNDRGYRNREFIMYKIKFGFTLAEVLVTIGIIGTVAVMVLSPLKTALDERSNMTALKKFYNEFYNATKRIILEKDIPYYWGLRNNNDRSSEMLINLYKEYMAIVKECSKTDSSCFPFPVRRSNDEIKITATDYRNWSMRGFVLKNGTTVCVDVNNGWFTVFFDVNGFKKPNKLGYDVYAWAVNQDGKIVSMYDPSISDETGKDSDYDYAFVYMANGWKKPK